MKFKLFIIISINILVVLVLIYHEKLLTKLDNYIMPNSAELCKIIPNSLIEKLKINMMEGVSFNEIENELKYLKLEPGGKRIIKKLDDSNSNTTTPNIAIIVPYRDRLINLELFLRNIHPFLSSQNVNYGIFIVEPIANLTFNKGISMNAGFVEALKEQEFDCFIFHDVDLLPENDKNIYGCDKLKPKLLAVAISAYGYSVEGYFKNKYFGGVTAFTKEQFKVINGFSNSYFGWGLEDDDARERVLNRYSDISRLAPDVGRYFANCHKQQKRNPDRFLLYINSNNRQDVDGLNSLNYQIAKKELTYLFTRIYISYENK